MIDVKCLLCNTEHQIEDRHWTCPDNIPIFYVCGVCKANSKALAVKNKEIKVMPEVWGEMVLPDTREIG